MGEIKDTLNEEKERGSMDKKARIGSYKKGSVLGERVYRTYTPKPLPPTPPLNLESLLPFLEKAQTALGRLDGMRSVLPNSSFFLSMYAQKEALLSSQIEGTQSSFSDLLLFEQQHLISVDYEDTAEVSSYIKAMEYGLEQVQRLPLSLRLIREIHEKLMSSKRGRNQQPGQFRTSQNWIGGRDPSSARFVPPPPQDLMECLDSFEKFLHDKSLKLPVLIKAALIHVQFETIHPFLDGNGRLGRLLITLILCLEGPLKEPILYLSLYFKTHRKRYYELLQSVRETGDWESWVQFFLEAVSEVSTQATQAANKILSLVEEDQSLIESKIKPTASLSVLKIYSYMKNQAVIATAKQIKEDNQLSLPTVLRSLKTLEELGIIKEITKKARHKIFIYKKYLDILSEGTEPIR